MTKALIIGIGVALVVPTFILVRSKIMDAPKPTSVEAARSLDVPTLAEVDAPKKRKSPIPEVYLPEPPPREFEYLPENKREAVKQAERAGRSEHKRRIKPGKQDAADIQELNKLLRELDLRLGQILTPEEKFEYDLHDSILGQSLKSVLFAMKPTDEEHRAIFRHRQEFEKRVAENPLSIDVAWKDCDEKVRASIGEERFKTYRMIQDATFLGIYNAQYGKRLEFEMVCDLYRVQSAAEEVAEKIRLDGALSNEAKLERLREVSAGCVSDMENVLRDEPALAGFQLIGKSIAARMESLRLRSPRYKPMSLAPSPGLVILSTGSDGH